MRQNNKRPAACLFPALLVGVFHVAAANAPIQHRPGEAETAGEEVREAEDFPFPFAVDGNDGLLREGELLDYVIDEIQGEPSLAAGPK